MKLNTDKTAVVNFTKRRPPVPPPLLLFGSNLEYSQHARYLGVDLDRKLTFRLHLQTIANRTTSKLLALYPILKSHDLTLKAKLHIYLIMIRPALTYAAPAWQHAAKTFHQLLQRVQNRAARMITGHSRDTRIMQLHEDLSLPMLDEHIDAICRSFWNRMSHSPHYSLQILGTAQPPRYTHRMPQPR